MRKLGKFMSLFRNDADVVLKTVYEQRDRRRKQLREFEDSTNGLADQLERYKLTPDADPRIVEGLSENIRNAKDLIIRMKTNLN